MEWEAVVAELRAENVTLREQLAAALAENADLRARLGKDSHNSSKPPSSDGLKRRPPLTRSLREKPQRKPGGQLGHRGETLHLVETPDVVAEHRPTVCAHCATTLEQTLPGACVERRQVHDLPPTRLTVTEQRALRVRCPACQRETVGEFLQFLQEAPSRAQYGPAVRGLAVYLHTQHFLPYQRIGDLLRDLYGLTLTVGSVVTWVQQSARALEPFETRLTAALHRTALIHSDESGVRVAGKTAWGHVTSTATLTHYAIHAIHAIHAKWGHLATDAIGILPDYQGVSVHDGWHDGWKAYQRYTTARHALCNVHHLRELTGVAESTGQTWAPQMQTLLREMLGVTQEARAQGAPHIAPSILAALRARYRTLVTEGLAANPPPQRAPHQRGRLAQSAARNLLERFLLYEAQVLAFLDDVHIPFDNNLAERDVRMLKVQHKVSGAFRSQDGADAFARVRSYLSPWRKQGGALLAAVRSTLAGPVLYPTFA